MLSDVFCASVYTVTVCLSFWSFPCLSQVHKSNLFRFFCSCWVKVALHLMYKGYDVSVFYLLCSEFGCFLVAVWADSFLKDHFTVHWRHWSPRLFNVTTTIQLLLKLLYFYICMPRRWFGKWKHNSKTYHLLLSSEAAGQCSAILSPKWYTCAAGMISDLYWSVFFNIDQIRLLRRNCTKVCQESLMTFPSQNIFCNYIAVDSFLEIEIYTVAVYFPNRFYLSSLKWLRSAVLVSFMIWPSLCIVLAKMVAASVSWSMRPTPRIALLDTVCNAGYSPMLS